MKKFLVSAAVLTLAASSMAIMQVDIAGSMFPAGAVVTQVSSTFATTYAPTVYRSNTSSIGPEENFGNWSVIFDYDQGPLVMPTFASRRIVGDFTLTFTCEDNSQTTQHWNPEGEMTYVFDAAFPFYTYEYPTDFFTMVPFGPCVSVDAEETPVNFNLADAFPNPFNPSTTISFSLPEAQDITLSVYNVGGQLVQTLVSGVVEMGLHNVTFDASELSSGMYLYTLETPSQSVTKKMVLVK